MELGQGHFILVFIRVYNYKPPTFSAQGFGEKWGNWVAWSECTASCGGGNQTRTRTCLKTPVFGAINDCTGPKSETKSCGNSPCDLSKLENK